MQTHDSTNSNMAEARVTVGTPAKEGFESVDLGSKGDSGDQSYLEKVADRINGALTGFFFKVGLSIGHNPRKWLFGTFLVFLIFTTGVAYPGLTNENRSDKLWVPADTQAQKDLTYVDGYYGSDARFGEVIIKPVDGGDALRPAIITALATLILRIQAATVEYDGLTLTWDGGVGTTAQCYKIGTVCAISHLTSIFSATTEYDTEAEIIAASTMRH